MNSITINTEKSAEPDRKNYAVLRRDHSRLETQAADRLAQDILCYFNKQGLQ